jgi:hypothetical protein
MMPYKYPSVLDGIPLEKAQSIADDEEDWFIVEASDGATGAEFLIAYGENKGVDVELISNSPASHLSNIFFLSQKNLLLVKGNELNIYNRGVEFSEAIPNVYTIDVNEWAIITPIKRDYQYRTRNQKSRWIYPRNCIDEFDIENGDYIPISYTVNESKGRLLEMEALSSNEIATVDSAVKFYSDDTWDKLLTYNIFEQRVSIDDANVPPT